MITYKDFVKAVISMEKASMMRVPWISYMMLIWQMIPSICFMKISDYMIEDLREQGQIKDLPYVQQEKDDLVNIVGNVVGNVDVIEIEK